VWFAWNGVVGHPDPVQRISTTVLTVVGAASDADLRALASQLGEGSNVRALLPELDAPTLDRAVAAWSEAARAHVPYVVHDADPLAEVASAWTDRWDGSDEVGRLEVAVAGVLQRWRARTLELPDYYLVVDPDELSTTARHWYLGVLATASPHRVVVTAPDVDEVVRTVRRLRAGRWWPDLDRLLDRVDQRVPDEVHLDGADGRSGPRLVT
jgi:hypothetical protein